MKRFVLRSLLFAVLLVGLVGGVCWAEISAEIGAYRRELAAPDGKKAVICGNSRTEMGLDPMVWPELFNFSVSGRTADQSFLTLIDVLEANPGKFKTVLIDISAEEACQDLSLPVGKLDFSAQYYLLYLLHPAERMRDLDGLVGVFRDNMVGKRLRAFLRALRGIKRFKSSLAAGFDPSDTCYPLSDPVKFKARVLKVKSQTDDLPSVTLAAPYFKLLDRMVAHCRARGAEPVFVTMPWHRDLIEARGLDQLRAYVDLVGRYALRQGCRYLNLLEMDVPDECWIDGNHLNRNGAKILTKRIADFAKGKTASDGAAVAFGEKAPSTRSAASVRARAVESAQ